MDEDIILIFFGLLPVVIGSGLWLFWRSRWRRAGGASRWLAVLCGNALLLLLFVALLLLGGEVYYRFIFDATDSLNYSKVSQRWFTKYYHQNAMGCRDYLQYALLTAPGKRRVTFVGDSFTAGHGVKKVEDLFALRLRQAHPDWEVHVLAQPGLDTGHELRELQLCASNHYQFGHVVLVYCLNDISELVPEIYESVQRIYADEEGSGWLRRNSYFVNTVYNRVNLVRNPDLNRYFDLIRQAYQGPAWDEQQSRLAELRDLVRTNGGTLSVVTFPFLNVLGPDYPYRFAHKKLDDCWRRLNVPHLDLLTVYGGMPPGELVVNRFDSHPNERAHALAARAIDSFLTGQMTGAGAGTNPAPSGDQTGGATAR